MANQPTNPLVRFIRRLAETQRWDTLSDQDLLHRYATNRDEAAFAALVRRYGPRLLRICWRVLRDHHDAEDVCQAAFLVLARKAGSRHWQSSVSYWLYKVALRLALEAKEAAARQQANARRVTVRQPKDPVTELCLRDVEAAFDEELARLPERLRLPVVLCHLEGQTRDQAAQQLGWSLSTLKRRLAQALKILHARLDRRGIALSTALLTIGVAEGAAVAGMPVVWIDATVRAAMQFTARRGIEGTEAVSQAATWAQGALQTMFMAKVKLASLLLTALLVMGAGGMAAHQKLHQQAGESPPQAKKTKRKIEQPSQPAPQAQAAQVDLYGDPLPSGAVARLGTVRFRHVGNTSGTMTFTPDGKTLLVAAYEGPPLLIDVVSGKRLRRFGSPSRDQFYKGAQLSPNGRLVAARVFDKMDPPGGITVWETATGKVVRKFVDKLPDGKNGYKELCCAFSPDSKALVAQCGDNLVLWEIATGRQLWTHQDKDNDYKCIAFSPDGKIIASSKNEGGVQLWDAGTGQSLQILGHSWYAAGIIFAGNGTTLVVSHLDFSKPGSNSVSLWDAATGKELKHLGVKASYCSAVSSDGKIMAIRGRRNENPIYLWDTVAGKELCRCEDSLGSNEIAFSPDGKILAARTGSLIRFWEVASGKIANPPQFRGHEGSASFVAFTPDGKTLISAGGDDTLQIWDTHTGQGQVIVPPEDTCRVRRDIFLGSMAAVFSDGKTVALCRNKITGSKSDNQSGSIHLWDIKTRRELRRFDAPKSYLCDAVFSPNEQILAVDDYTANGVSVCLWDVATGKQRKQKFLGDKPRFSTNSILLTWCPEVGKKQYVLWDATTGEKVTSISVSAESSESVQLVPSGGGAAFSPDGQSLAIAVHSQTEVKGIGFPAIYRYPLYRSKRGRVHLGPPRIINSSTIASFENLVFSSDGRILAAANGIQCSDTERRNKTIYLFDTASGKERTHFTGHDYPITCLAFSPDGRQLASGCQDSTILLWDVTGRAQQDRGSAVHLTKQEFETLWEDLASSDASRAGRAIWTLIAVGPQVVSWCQARLRPIPAVQAETVTKLIADLDDNAFAVRQKAKQQLQALGEIAEPSLRQVLEGQLSLELRRSVDQLLTFVESQRAAPSGEVLRGVRAIEILEHIGTREARQCLEVLGGGAPGVRLTEEAKAAVARLSRRKSK